MEVETFIPADLHDIVRFLHFYLSCASSRKFDHASLSVFEVKGFGQRQSVNRFGATPIDRHRASNVRPHLCILPVQPLTGLTAGTGLSLDSRLPPI
jgi:hypothetical protein